jgi:hypothetical protein
MNHQELYNSLTNAKIKESIYISTKLVLKEPGDPDKTFDILVNTFVSVASYIGSYISIYEIRLWLDVCEELIELIENPKIIMKNIYITITKLCILCDIYIKNPIAKVGVMNVKLLRSKVIDMFDGINFKLTDAGMSRFEGIFPPCDSPTYALAKQIITGYVFVIKELDNLSSDDDISDVANKIRKSFDYIIRKKYEFETKFYANDCDAVWFLWGLICLLYQDRELDVLYQLFNIGYNNKKKQQRVGLLWGAALVMVYIKKKDMARCWNTKEVRVIKKIDEVSMQLYRDIKKELISTGYIQPEEKTNKSIDGLEYILAARYQISDKIPDKKDDDNRTDNADAAVKMIRYKKHHGGIF